MDLLMKLIPSIDFRRYEESAVDRLNFQYTSYAYVFFAVLVMSKQYMGTAITCWTPAEFRRGWIEYTTDYCLIENTYWVPIDDPTLPHHVQREHKELPYYQWVQFVLVFLAFCFMIPHYIWRSLNWRTGVQVRSIIKTCIPTKDRGLDVVMSKSSTDVAAHMYSSFKQLTKRQKESRLKLISQMFVGQTITSYYVLMKLLFIVNILVQLIVLHIFLGFNPFRGYYMHGWNSDWKSSGLFPRTTMCDFEVRTKGNVQRYTVQCVLSLNMFNEKIFAVLFLWLVVLVSITIVDTIRWILFLYSKSNRQELMKKLLYHAGVKALSAVPNEGEKAEYLSEDAANNYSNFVQGNTPDMALVYKLLVLNAGPGVASQVAGKVFALYTADGARN